MSILEKLNSEQQKAVQATEGPVLVLAGAGSGKTRTLTHRIAYLILEKKVPPRDILAVTFTNKAADEMKERVHALLGRKAVIQRSAGDMPSPLIGTFHSVCARILRLDGAARGYKSNFTIFDTADQLRSVKEVLGQLSLSPKEYNPKILLRLIERAKRECISPDEFEDAFSREVGASQLKQTARVYHGYQEYLALSNAADFGDLLFQTVLLFRDHPAILKRYQDRFVYLLVDEYQDTNFVQYEWCRLLSLKHKNFFVVGDDYQSIYSFRGADIRNILEFNRDHKTAQVIALRQNYRSTKNILALANTIIKKNDLQTKKELWTDNPEGALPQVAELEDEREEGIFVLQRIKKDHGLMEKKEGPSHLDKHALDKNDTTKADTDEITYDYLDEEDEYPGEQDQSSTGGILDRVMMLQSEGRGTSLGMDPPFPDVDRQIIEEFEGVDWSACNLNNYVVLYRTNAQSRALEEVCMSYGVPYRIVGGVAFYERKEIKDVLAYLRLLHNPHDMISLERVISVSGQGIGEKTRLWFVDYCNSQGIDFLQAAARMALAGEGGESKIKRLKPFCVLLTKMHERLKSGVSVAKFIDAIVFLTNYQAYLKRNYENGKERIENINELKTVADRYTDKKGAEGLRLFLEEVSLMSAVDRLDSSANALTLMTLHAAKGLEFPSVFIVGLEQGLFPHESALLDRTEIEEERRLCYVGITRAKERLYLLHARLRHLYGSTRYGEPSEFIARLDTDLIETVSYE